MFFFCFIKKIQSIFWNWFKFQNNFCKIIITEKPQMKNEQIAAIGLD